MRQVLFTLTALGLLLAPAAADQIIIGEVPLANFHYPNRGPKESPSMVSLHLHVFTQPRAIADISLEAVISREASLVTGAGVMAAGDRDPMRLPVIPASATAMRQIHSTSAPPSKRS
jgi:hypothetical protein